MLRILGFCLRFVQIDYQHKYKKNLFASYISSYYFCLRSLLIHNFINNPILFIDIGK
jgi:hypothetical protein